MKTPVKRKEEVSLRVAKAFVEDEGKGLARVDEDVLKSLGRMVHPPESPVQAGRNPDPHPGGSPQADPQGCRDPPRRSTAVRTPCGDRRQGPDRLVRNR